MNQICQSILIEVPDLNAAIENYRRLLNADPIRREESLAQFALKRLLIELRESNIPSAAIKQVRLAADGNPNNIPSPSPCFDFTCIPVPTADPAIALDMVCYMTADADKARADFALDPLNLEPRKTIRLGNPPVRLSFFKLGSTLLELIENPSTRTDGFWGLSFGIENIEAYHRYLTDNGVAISEIRSGRKPGTRVATIKSHNLGLPSLLIGPAI